MIGVVDCNNFFASCEEVFRPKLRGKPLVVLSGEDGCIIARSQEAKKLGIPMGAPAFQCEALFKKYQVETCFSNFSLYADMSKRVMETLSLHLPVLERYSIDEVFFEIKNVDYAHELKKIVYQWTGIPVSIGIARTKVLAKLSVEHAKAQGGIFILTKDNERAFLESKSVEDIWGIGAQSAKKLRAQGVYTAYDLAQSSQKDVTLKRIALELQGNSVLELEEVKPARKSISMARSFKEFLQDEEAIASVLASYTARVSADLRSEGLSASIIQVWLVTNDFKSSEQAKALPQKSTYTPQLVQVAKELLHQIFDETLQYRKVGVCLSGLEPSDYRPDFFMKPQEREKKLMDLLDGVNEKFKKGLRFASEI